MSQDAILPLKADLFSSHAPTDSAEEPIIFGKADLTICNQIDVDASGNARALIFSKAITLKDLIRGDQNAHFTIPGFGFDYYSNATSSYLIWSVRLSLLIPVALFFIVAKVFRRRLKRLQFNMRPVASGAIRQTPAPPAPPA